jgi:LPXTG-motif cell wall-anchored protein
MPYRPSADASCATATQWKNAAGSCFSGFGFVISFDLAGMTVPDELVYSIAYNTNTWGASPLGVSGPYESLNVGLAPNQGVGTDVNPDLVFWNTQTAANYSDNGAGGTGTFRPDTGWASTGGPAAQFIAVAPVVTTTSTTIAAAGGPTTTAVASGGATTTSVASLAPELPGTGSNSTGWVIAAGLVLVGIMLVMNARRPRRS